MPAGILIGFASEDAWFEYRLENDPRFLSRIGKARLSLKQGGGERLEGHPLSSDGCPQKHSA
jgi:hypothetical protein